MHRFIHFIALTVIILSLIPAQHAARAANPARPAASVDLPPNPLPHSPDMAFRLNVAATGMQRVTGASLLALGAPAQSMLSHLSVSLRGAPLVMQALDRNNNGQLESDDALYFEALEAGGPWSSTTPYWLTISGQVAHISVAGSANPANTSALTAQAPAIERRPDIDLTQPRAAREIFIAPAAFHAALAPLLALRGSQNISTLLVDPQTIYDTWHYGEIDPEAIRSFLRYARANALVTPIALVLVGDGSYDPAHPDANRDASVIPPYIADVDLWMGSSACDWCYAQLDGDDPKSDARADLLYGRIPARTVADVAAVVAKIVRYETAPDAPWRTHMAFIADNFQEADGARDGAGNFAELLDGAIAHVPRGWQVNRVYSDPFPPSAALGPWRLPDASAARAQTQAAFDQGAAFIAYSGHGQIDRWADTAPDADGANWLLQKNDVAKLKNAQALPVVLELACLTGAFQKSDKAGGATIDEHLLLAPAGGAVAVLGTSGWGVTYAHDFVLKGMFDALRNAPGDRVRLGDLVRGGFDNLRENGGCCGEMARTAILLGDPLMQIRKPAPVSITWLPIMTVPAH